MTEGIQACVYYRQTYNAKQFLLRVLFIIGFVLFTRFDFQSLLPETMFLLLPTSVHIYQWVCPKFILGIYNAHAHAL
jgi:hypothetical protein